jgi:hypothetical protein
MKAHRPWKSPKKRVELLADLQEDMAHLSAVAQGYTEHFAAWWQNATNKRLASPAEARNFSSCLVLQPQFSGILSPDWLKGGK